MTLLIYDNTEKSKFLLWSWVVGTFLYVLFGRAKARKGVASWDEAFDWIIEQSAQEKLSELQMWGHGYWGAVKIGETWLSARRFGQYEDKLNKIKENSSENCLWWFRSCNVAGAVRGQEFVTGFAEKMGAVVAAHTFIVWVWHSGLRLVKPGKLPDWSPEEGIKEGTPEDPKKPLWAKPWSPRAMTCLRTRVPKKWRIW